MQFGEGGERCDAEDEKKALAGFHIQLPARLVRGRFGFCGGLRKRGWENKGLRGKSCALPHRG